MLKLTVILPTYNRLDQLKLVLTGLENQTYPLDRFEVIVISDGSTDGTEAYFQTTQSPLQIRFIQQQNGGAASARNTGIDHAKSELVLFIDDDVVPAPELIDEHLRVHDDSDDTIVVIGPMLTPPDYEMHPWVFWEQEMLYKQYHSMRIGEYEPSSRQFYTGNTSLSLERLKETGGFDTRFRRAEDVELAYRLADQGLKFIFAPKAIGYHYADRSFKSWFATPYAYGKNDVIFAQEKGQSWLLPQIAWEYLKRNFFIRLFTWVLLDRLKLSKSMIKLLRFIARFGHRIHVDAFERIAYSFMFNLQYYQGVSDEYGGRGRFFAGIRKTRQYLRTEKNKESEQVEVSV